MARLIKQSGRVPTFTGFLRITRRKTLGAPAFHHQHLLFPRPLLTLNNARFLAAQVNDPVNIAGCAERTVNNGNERLRDRSVYSLTVKVLSYQAQMGSVYLSGSRTPQSICSVCSVKSRGSPCVCSSDTAHVYSPCVQSRCFCAGFDFFPPHRPWEEHKSYLSGGPATE